MESLRGLGAYAEALIDKVQTADPTLRSFLAGTAALLETNVVTGLLLPGDTVMLVAAAAVRGPQEGFLLGIAVSVGAFLGEVIGYWLGRWVGSGFHRGTWVRRRAGEEWTGSAAQMVASRGGPWILASRFIPVLRTITPFVAGLNAFPFRRFVAWSAPACVLWSTIYISVYASASSSLRSGSESPALSVLLVVLGLVLLVGSLVVQVMYRRWHAKESARLEVPM